MHERGGAPRTPTAQEVKGGRGAVWLLGCCGKLLGCEQVLLELSSVLSPAAPSVACLLGGVSFKSAYARFVFSHLKTRMPPNSPLTTRQSQRHGVMLRFGYVTAHVLFWLERDTICCGPSVYGSCRVVGVLLA